MKPILSPLKLNKSVLAIILITFLLNIHYNSIAQNVGISDASFTPDAKAVLDVQASAGLKGMLIPRMTWANRPPALVAAQDGMLIYSTDGDGTNGPGFYYWDNTAGSWYRVGSGNGSMVMGTGTTDYLARWTSATNIGNGVTRDNNSTVGINVAPNVSYRLFVDGASAMTSVRGQYSATRFGDIGRSDFGVYGQFDANIGGYIGGITYGVYGQFDATIYGAFGGSTFGALAAYTAVSATADNFGAAFYNTNNSATDNTNKYGVYSQVDGNVGTGTNRFKFGFRGVITGTADANYSVYGESSGATTNWGVVGSATGAATTNYGIYGNASGGTTNWAGYFNNGYVHIVNKLGLNTTTIPNTYVDINGDFAYRQGTLGGLAAGANADVNIGTNSYLTITDPGGAFSISGFTPVYDGKILTLVNRTGRNMTLTDNASSVAANRIYTGSGIDITCPDESVVQFQYSTAHSRWLVSGGQNLGLSNAWVLTGNNAGPASYLGTNNARDLRFYTNGTEKMRLLQTGELGIGLVGPAEQLQITENFRLPATGAGFVGVIYSDANTYIHCFGTQNFFAGVNAGNLTLTTATDNVGLGFQSLNGITTGDFNIAIGSTAGDAITTGSGNVAIGYGAVSTNNTGSGLTGIGYNALTLNQATGTANTAVGYQAGDAISTGDNNTALGYDALGANTTASNNTGIGYQALLLNTTSASNTSVGYRTLSSQTVNCNNNTAVGFDALFTNGSGGVTATDNAGFGYYALRANTSGDENSGFGSSALRTNTTGLRNTAVGSYALFSNDVDNNNTAVGNNALYSNAAGGNDNTAIGYYSLRGNTTGDYNVVTGSNALSANTSGNNNVALGYQAGQNATNTLSGCIYLGYQAGQANTIANRLFIENSNNIVTPLIFGDFTNNRVGINTLASTYDFEVNGTIRAGVPGTDGQLRIYSEMGGTDYEVIFNPSASMTMNTTYTLPVDDGTVGQVLSTDGAGILSWLAAGTGTVTGTGTTPQLAYWTGASSIASPTGISPNILQWDNASSRLGIRIVPTMALDVTSATITAGESAIRGASTGNAGVYGILGSATSATGFGIYGSNSNASGTGVLGTGNNIGGSYLVGGSGGAFSSTNVGVYGYGNATAGSAGVYGNSLAIDGAGVIGINTAAAGSNTGVGVYGLTAQDWTGSGVWAESSHADGNPVWANITAGAGAGTGISIWGVCNQSGGFAIQGDNSRANGTGIVGTGDNVAPITLVTGTGGAFTGQDIGLLAARNSDFNTNGEGAAYFMGRADGTQWAAVAYRTGGTWYKITGSGANPGTTVLDKMGNQRGMTCPETPEIQFQDFGQGTLVSGKAHIELDTLLRQYIKVDEKHPLRVFIQLEGECNGVYVTNKSGESFDVIELNNGNSNIPFTWFITANRADLIDGNTGEVISKHADVRFPIIEIPQVINQKIKKEKMRTNLFQNKQQINK